MTLSGDAPGTQPGSGVPAVRTTSIVVDCSTTMAWCFADEATESAHAVLAMLRATGAVVPQIWPLEVANVLAVAERRDRISRAEASEFIDLLRRLDIEVDGDTADCAMAVTLDLARAHILSAYDAAYLELAMRRGVPLATGDHKLRRVAETVGVAVVA